MNKIIKNSPCGISLTGKVRQNNEDSFLYTNEDGWKNQFAIVADGIGGNIHGEIASRLCCQYFYELWEKKNAMNLDDPKQMEKFMLASLNEVNSEIFRINCQSDFIEAPMGATVVAAAFMPKDIVIIHAGDSRFYDHRSNGKLACLTVDHTLLQKNRDLIDDKLWADFINSELCNYITKSVGTSKSIDDDPKAPLLSSIKRRPDSRYLLCSDGLTHMVSNEQISTILNNTPDNRKAMNKLIAACFAEGAVDNISIVLY